MFSSKVTESKLANTVAALRQKTAAQESALEDVGLLLIADDDKTVLWANDRLGELFGLNHFVDPHQITPAQSRKILSELEARFVDLQWYTPGISGDFVGSVKLSETQGSVPRLIQQTIKPIYDPQGKYLGRVQIYQDVTERKRLEEQFIRTQKMESLGKLIRGISHEFNNVFGTIMGYSELALLEAPSYGNLMEQLQQIQRATNRGASLSRRLVSFSDSYVPDKEVINISELLADTTRILRKMIREDIHLSVSVSDQLDLIHGDPYQIEQILMNLSLNATDAMPRGGTISITATNATLDTMQASMHQVDPGRYISITVRDTGVGLTPEAEAHLFEPFFSTKALGQGSGLGLYTTYQIVEQHKGHIKVYSRPREGSLFTVYLPSFAPDGKANPNETSESMTDLPGGNELVLIVENDAAIRNAITNTLRVQGYRVLQASNGLEALSVAKSMNEAIDLIVTDLTMPLIGGIEMVRQLRRTQPLIKVIFMSRYTDFLNLDDLADLGSELLEKPFMPYTLAMKVRNVLDKP